MQAGLLMKSTTNKFAESVFIDSSAWISFLILTDSNNSRSYNIFQNFTAKTELFTSLFILDEVVTKIRRSLNQKEADKFYKRLKDLEKRKYIVILPVEISIVDKAFDLLNKHPTPNTFTLTDATNII